MSYVRRTYIAMLGTQMNNDDVPDMLVVVPGCSALDWGRTDRQASTAHHPPF